MGIRDFPEIRHVMGVLSREPVCTPWQPEGPRNVWIGPGAGNSGTGAPEPAFRPRGRIQAPCMRQAPGPGAGKWSGLSPGSGARGAVRSRWEFSGMAVSGWYSRFGKTTNLRGGRSA